MPRRSNKALASRAALYRETAFVHFCRLGSIELAAQAVGCAPDELEAFALADGWEAKLEALKAASSGTPQVERLVNRGQSFEVADKLRRFAGSVLSDLLAQIERGEATALALVTEIDTTANGSKARLNAKAIADLARAIQVADSITGKALGDTVTERLEREEETGAGLSQQGITDALNALNSLGKPEPAQAPVEPRPAQVPPRTKSTRFD